MPPRARFVFLAIFCCAGASAQVERLTPKLKISDTDLASCYEETTGKLLGSQLVRSHVFISPGGRYRAYIEVEAIASKSKTKRHSSPAACLFAPARTSPIDIYG